MISEMTESTVITVRMFVQCLSKSICAAYTLARRFICEKNSPCRRCFYLTIKYIFFEPLCFCLPSPAVFSILLILFFTTSREKIEFFLLLTAIERDTGRAGLRSSTKKKFSHKNIICAITYIISNNI